MNKLNLLHPRMLFKKNVEIDPLVLENKIYKLINVFSLFRNLLPLEKGVVLHMNEMESPSHKDSLRTVLLKLAH